MDHHTISGDDWKRAIEEARRRRELMPERIRAAISAADKKLKERARAEEVAEKDKQEHKES